MIVRHRLTSLLTVVAALAASSAVGSAIAPQGSASERVSLHELRSLTDSAAAKSQRDTRRPIAKASGRKIG